MRSVLAKRRAMKCQKAQRSQIKRRRAAGIGKKGLALCGGARQHEPREEGCKARAELVIEGRS